MTLLADDGYVRIARQDAVPGDLVVYAPDATSNFQHVGIIYTVPVAGDGILDMMVLSKWGEAGEYLHPLNKVPPMYGKPQSFWTEKRIISS